MALARGQEGSGVRQTEVAAVLQVRWLRNPSRRRPGLLHVRFGAVEAVDGDVRSLMRRGGGYAITCA